MYCYTESIFTAEKNFTIATTIVEQAYRIPATPQVEAGGSPSSRPVWASQGDPVSNLKKSVWWGGQGAGAGT